MFCRKCGKSPRVSCIEKHMVERLVECLTHVQKGKLHSVLFGEGSTLDWCEIRSVPDEYKPILLSNGVRKRFPAPTIRVQHPKKAGKHV